MISVLSFTYKSPTFVDHKLSLVLSVNLTFFNVFFFNEK